MAFLRAIGEVPADLDERPYVETSIARQLTSRLEITHEERGISVFSGPWGIGKTTSLDKFMWDHYPCCAIVKVDPGNSKRGSKPSLVLQLAIEAICPLIDREPYLKLNNAYWSLRITLFNLLQTWRREHFGVHGEHDSGQDCPKFTFIFDEAQYLSPEAIEALRYWNDADRGSLPFPVGLVFVGNNEFALQEDAGGNSVLSGAVRSRALFVESLEYADVSDADLVLFLRSRGIVDGGAIDAVIAYFKSPRQRRDLRNVERLVGIFKRRAGQAAVSAEIVRSILNP